MVQTVVFLVNWPITAADIAKFKFNIFKNHGFEVIIFDFSYLLHKSSLSHLSDSLSSDDFKNYRISSYKDLDLKIKEIAAHTIFIDILNGIAGFNLARGRVFRILKKHRAKYYILHGGSRPIEMTSISKTFQDRLQFIRKKIQKASNLSFLLEYFINQIFFLLTKYARFLPLPDKIFASPSEMLDLYLKKYNLNPKKVTFIHSNDYELYLEDQKKNQIIPPTEKISIFLDEGATSHPDWAIDKKKPLHQDEYHPTLNRFFDAIEEKMGLKVIIAMHPKASYSNASLLFGNREILKGQTFDLVKRCSLVIAHASTAVNYAVIFNKPVLLIKTPDMIRHDYYSHAVDSLAIALELETVVTTMDDFEIFRTQFAHHPNGIGDYNNYKFKYVQSKEAGDKTAAEIICHEIIKTNENPLSL